MVDNLAGSKITTGAVFVKLGKIVFSPCSDILRERLFTWNREDKRRHPCTADTSKILFTITYPITPLIFSSNRFIKFIPDILPDAEISSYLHPSRKRFPFYPLYPSNVRQNLVAIAVISCNAFPRKQTQASR